MSGGVWDFVSLFFETVLLSLLRPKNRNKPVFFSRSKPKQIEFRIVLVRTEFFIPPVSRIPYRAVPGILQYMHYKTTIIHECVTCTEMYTFNIFL